jgi:hypothetical protein
MQHTAPTRRNVEWPSAIDCAAASRAAAYFSDSASVQWVTGEGPDRRFHCSPAGLSKGAAVNRSTKGPTLYVRGRDVDEQEKALHFNKSSCRWTIIGEAAEVHQTQSRNKILTFLTDVRLVSEPVGPKLIAKQTDMAEDLANKTIGRMVEDGEVIRVKRGLYIAARRTDLQKS